MHPVVCHVDTTIDYKSILKYLVIGLLCFYPTTCISGFYELKPPNFAGTNVCFYRGDWLILSRIMDDFRRGFGLDIGFIDHFNPQLVITLHYRAITDLRNL
jgi:hypothetical protein